jgi:uncharacterized phage protein gp47/JayE
MAGVSTTGFIPKTLTEIKAEIEASVLAVFGAEFDVSAESPLGQLIAIFAEREAAQWEAQEEAYAAFTRDGASEQSLDNVGALTGTPREAAKRSTVTATLTGTNGTVVPTGTIFAVQTVGTQFRTTEDATISGGTASAACESVETGPKLAPAATLTVIVNPVAGLTSVTNSLDAAPGADLEADSVYRRRQESELRAAGKAALAAIRESLLQLDDVDSVTVFENTSDSTDGDGLPPHSIECLVSGGDDTDIAETIFSEKAAGVATYGTDTVTVTDEQGIDHDINFSRPTDLDLYVVFNLIIDTTKWPADGAAQVKAAAVAYGDATYVTGKDVISAALGAQALTVAGVLDPQLPRIGFAPSPGASTTLTVGLRQRAVIDTSRITVNVTSGTP